METINNRTTSATASHVTTILWLSRHEMTPDQLSELKDIYGDVDVRQSDMTVASWRDVVEAGKDCDVLAVVLPPAILADLTNPRNNTKPVIRAIANRVPTGKTVVNPATGKEEAQYAFQHAGWERVLRVQILTERLGGERT